jgi:hypothetical protein
MRSGPVQIGGPTPSISGTDSNSHLYNRFSLTVASSLAGTLPEKMYWYQDFFSFFPFWMFLT